jgi:hypothetical protein
MCVNYLYVIGNVQFFRFFWGVRWPRRLIANSDCFTQTNGSLNLFFRFQNQRTFSYYVHNNNLSVRFGRIQQVYNAAIGDLDSYNLSNWAIVNTLLFQLQTNTYVYTENSGKLVS